MAGINDKANFADAIVSLLLQTSFAMLFKVLEKPKPTILTAYSTVAGKVAFVVKVRSTDDLKREFWKRE